jgi:hypothetical protein
VLKPKKHAGGESSLNDWKEAIRAAAKQTENAIGDFEGKEFRMRNWFPRWIANKYEELLRWAMGKEKYQRLADWAETKKIPLAAGIMTMMVCIVGLVAVLRAFVN